MFFSIVLPNMYCCKIQKFHKTSLNSSLCKLPTILEPDTANHFNEPQQTAHVETAVSTICKSCLWVAPTPERLSMTVLLFTVVLKFNFCQHWQMPSTLMPRLIYMEKAKHMQRFLCLCVDNGGWQMGLTISSHFWAIDKIHLRSVGTVKGKARGIWMKREESQGSGECCV